MTKNDVVFATVGGRDLKLDLFAPEGENVPTRTAVIMLHGGGWVQGARGMMIPLALQLAARGYLAIPADYRLVPESPWPAQRDDAAAAVAWVADHADDLGIDASRIVLLGASVGGQLAMTAAAGPSKGIPAAVVAMFTPGQLGLGHTLANGQFDASMLLGAQASQAEVDAASPIRVIGEGFPPTFLIHGGRDWLIDPASSLALFDHLSGLGVDTEIHILAAAHHEFVSEPGMTGPVADAIGLFLDRVIVDPGKWVAEAEAANIFAKGPEAFQAMVEQMMAAQKG